MEVNHMWFQRKNKIQSVYNYAREIVDISYKVEQMATMTATSLHNFGKTIVYTRETSKGIGVYRKAVGSLEDIRFASRNRLIAHVPVEELAEYMSENSMIDYDHLVVLSWIDVDKPAIPKGCEEYCEPILLGVLNGDVGLAYDAISAAEYFVE
jgi:hypothetical protein